MTSAGSVAQTPLARRLELQSLVARLASGFVRLPVENVDRGIVEALAQIAEFLGIDRAGVFRSHDAATRVTLTHEWHAPSLASLSGSLQNVALDGFPDTRASLNRGKPVRFSDREEGVGPAELKRILELGDLKSVALLPVQADERFGGFVVFGWQTPDRHLADDEQVLLDLVGTMVRNLLRRRRIEERRRAHEARFQSLMNSNVIGILLGRFDGTIVDVNDVLARRIGYRREDLSSGRGR
jgi:GAF domain-containing protein